VEERGVRLPGVFPELLRRTSCNRLVMLGNSTKVNVDGHASPSSDSISLA
jgi:hypothetical protein